MSGRSESTTADSIRLEAAEMSHRSTQRVGVVVLNYRTPDLVEECLASMEPEAAQIGMQVVIVDNASADGSAERIADTIKKRRWGDWVQLVRSPVNGGFAAGNNIGIGYPEADAYLLLNSDTIVRPGALARLAQELDRHPDAGIIGPRLEWPDGTPQISAFRFPTPVTELLRASGTGVISRMFRRHVTAIDKVDGAFEPDWVSFAAVLIRRDLVKQIGLLDIGYFMYFDDVDYCRRARAANCKVRYCPDARVVHLRGESGTLKANAAARKRLPRYWYASRARYYAKFYGRSGLWLANGLWLVGRGISWLREVAERRSTHIPEKQFADIWTNWRDPLKLPQETTAG